MTRNVPPANELYLVCLEPVPPSLEIAGAELVQLRDGLFLARTELSQSKLYHLVKRTATPATLCVGRLADAPKFKGMKPGSLAWLRAGG